MVKGLRLGFAGLEAASTVPGPGVLSLDGAEETNLRLLVGNCVKARKSCEVN